MRAYDLEVTGSLVTTGSLKVIGDITAEQYQIRTTITQVTMSAVSGSSRFGDSVDDTHIFTGSLSNSGSISSNGNVSGSATATGSFGAGIFDGNVTPTADNNVNLGAASLRWANVYTADLHLNNEGNPNIVDGTTGNWTVQEGEEYIYLVNNKSNEKFKLVLEKIE